MRQTICIVLALFTQQALAGESPDQPFIGTWQLVSVEQKNDSGDWEPSQINRFSNAVGVLMYGEEMMSVHIMNPDRPVAGGPDRPTRADLAAILNGYVAYFGPYEVNVEEGYVIHHRMGHLGPAQVGVDAKRFFEFEGDELTLTVAPNRNVRLTWQRMGR